MDWLTGMSAGWWWIAGGLVLAGLELAVPGVYLIWLAVAALITGAIALVMDFGIAVQVVNFVALALIAAYSARRILRDKPIESTDPMLNNRAGRLIGQTAVVTVALTGGEGRVRHGDSEWIAHGPDAAIGQRVRILGMEGSALQTGPLEPAGNGALSAPSGKPD